MSTTLTTTSLGISNVRDSSRQTRINPARTLRNARPTLRQNSLLSNPTSAQGATAPEPHGFYPAITHFSDAIAALPRDFRRHTLLLKEVDAKAWAIEENIQKLLKECLHERQTQPATSTAQTVAGSVASVAGDHPNRSAADSTNGNILDTASQYSTTSVDTESLRRRRLYAELRNQLMQMIMPLDEKNHVINNANGELSRHVRRQDEIWPHIADEISEEARLGSLKHWALTDLNPTKKMQVAAARGRDAALALLPDNDIAERSERRREAILAKKKQAAQHADSDAEMRGATRKAPGAAKAKQVDEDLARTGLQVTIVPALKKSKSIHKKVVEQETTKKAGSAAIGGTAMSRENSQQEASKKRKAPTSATTVARKRIIAATQGSPKLAHSPLAEPSGRETGKKSPAFSHVRPVNGRVRQSSAQSGESSNLPTTSSASRRNGVTASGAELDRVMAATGKTANEVKQTMKETVNNKGEKFLEEDIPDTVENRVKGGILLERSASKSSLRNQTNVSDEPTSRRTAIPRLQAAHPIESLKIERNGKSKASKTPTPLAASFADVDQSESGADQTSTAENGNDTAFKPKRLARPRMKDHHGLQDSLSPKALPPKRTHKKNGSYSLTAALIPSRNNTKERDEEAPAMDRKAGASRTNSRSTKNNSTTDTNKETRHASSTPKIGGPASELVDEPDSLSSANNDDAKQPVSRRQSQQPKHARQASTQVDTKPQRSSRATASHPHQTPAAAASPAAKPDRDSPPLVSPDPNEEEEEEEEEEDEDEGDDAPPALVPDAPADAPDEEEDEEDPNEQRYCYCNGVSYGEMVGCDNDDCAREWFHLECIGLKRAPPENATWYCDECKSARMQ